MKSISITHKWKKFFGVGCSHGNCVDEDAVESVLAFRDRYKPDFTFHLGDAFDMTAFRSGAKGTTDESKPIKPDFSAGIDFLERLRPNVLLAGNHEDRLWHLQHHHSAIVSELAGSIVADIEATCRKLKCRLIPYAYKAHYRLGDFRLMHGTFFNENAPRDHAEAYGNVIHAHTHRAGQAKGRRDDNPTGLCVGTLTKISNMDYAKNRRATLAWSQGCVFGVFNDTRAIPWLCEKGQDQAEWVFPL